MKITAAGKWPPRPSHAKSNPSKSAPIQSLSTASNSPRLRPQTLPSKSLVRVRTCTRPSSPVTERRLSGRAILDEIAQGLRREARRQARQDGPLGVARGLDVAGRVGERRDDRRRRGPVGGGTPPAEEGPGRGRRPGGVPGAAAREAQDGDRDVERAVREWGGRRRSLRVGGLPPAGPPPMSR